uniref:G-protein coupled receptors family 1 profile domain-containing protein n=1 Tax=Plectus sambesii TaxID=2011161 RepID=A0A914XBV2_9BILA
MKSNLSHELPIFSVPRLSSNKIVAHLEATLRAATLRLNETCNSFTNGAFCDDRPLYHLLMGNMFMLLLVLCVFGNCVNLIIYHSDQMRQFLAIKMLSAKVLLNTLLMVCFLPQALRICQIWSANSGAEAIYWQTWPYLMYLINVLGFCSMWLTVLITFEYYLHVAFPTHSKLWCNEANVSKCSFIILLVALSLHLIVPLNRIIDKLRCPGNRIFYQVTMRPGN